MKQPSKKTIPRDRELLIQFLNTKGYLADHSINEIIDCKEDFIEFALTRVSRFTGSTLIDLCKEFLKWTSQNEVRYPDPATGVLIMTPNWNVTSRIIRDEYLMRKHLEHSREEAKNIVNSLWSIETFRLPDPTPPKLQYFSDLNLQPKIDPDELVPNGTVKLWREKDLVPELFH